MKIHKKKITAVVLSLIMCFVSMSAFASYDIKYSRPVSECDGNYYIIISGSGALPNGQLAEYSYDQNHGTATSIEIKSGITSIGTYNFANWGDNLGHPIIDIQLPDTLTSIGDYAFANVIYDSDYDDSNWSGSVAVDFCIPSSVTTIGTNAFKNFTADTITIHKPRNSISGSPWGFDGEIIWDGTADLTDTSSISVGNIGSQVYTGSAITPDVTVTCNGAELEKGTDYTLTYTNNTNIGTATVKITGKGSYTGTITKTFAITKKSVSGLTISAIANQTYTGSAIAPSPSVKYGNVTLVKDKDYTLTYTNNTNVGTATIKITGKGNYTGTTSKTFNITQKSANSLSISAIANQTYTGSAITPTVVVTDMAR